MMSGTSGPSSKRRAESSSSRRCALPGQTGRTRPSTYPSGSSKQQRSGSRFRSSITSGWSVSSCSQRPIIGVSSTGRISTCCALREIRPRARLPKASARKRLSQAQRFEEFNRRFAFILHDIKNLVSQLSLLARNAERHADNPEFRTDMVATLRGSVGKMNDLLDTPDAPCPRAGAAHSAPVAPSNPHRQPSLQDGVTGRSTSSARLSSTRWSMQTLSSKRSVIFFKMHSMRAVSEPVTVRVDRDGDKRHHCNHRQRGRHGWRLHSQPTVPAFLLDQARRVRNRRVRSAPLITAMGGRLTVDSRLGRGTTFTITLPAANAAVEPKRKLA